MFCNKHVVRGMDPITNSLRLHASGHFANVMSCRNPTLNAQPPVLAANKLMWVRLSPGGKAFLVCLSMRPRKHRWKADHAGSHQEEVAEGGFLLLDIFLAGGTRGGPSFICEFIGFTVTKPMGGKPECRGGVLRHVRLDFYGLQERSGLPCIVPRKLVSVVQGLRELGQ
jgi:hypothetical protein